MKERLKSVGFFVVNAIALPIGVFALVALFGIPFGWWR